MRFWTYERSGGSVSPGGACAGPAGASRPATTKGGPEGPPLVKRDGAADYQLPPARQPPVAATVQERVNWPGEPVVFVMLKTLFVPSDVALIV
jgi:hypothetical protein